MTERFEEPEGFTKCQTDRFGCAYMALIFRKRFCRTNINDYSIVQKGFVPLFFREDFCTDEILFKLRVEKGSWESIGCRDLTKI